METKTKYLLGGFGLLFLVALIGGIYLRSKSQVDGFDAEEEEGFMLRHLGGNTSIGYEMVDSETLHFWNEIDDYYLNMTSGIQLTNHYDDYWTKNVFCIGYYSGDEWVKIKCSDELGGFNQTILTDNETFVNITLWKDFTYSGYDIRLGIRDSLGSNDTNLSITIYGKNLGIDIPFDLGFAWKVTDWDIPSNLTDDVLMINNTEYWIKGNYNLTFKNLSESFFMGKDTTTAFGGEFLRVDWNGDLNYAVKMYGNGVQEDFYVALLINAGHFNPQQEKSTTFQWIDAVVVGTSAGFVTVAPKADPAGSTGDISDAVYCTKDTSNSTATKITELGFWVGTISSSANYEIGIYDHDSGNDAPDSIVHVTTGQSTGLAAGWKTVTGLDIAIDSSTIYWVCVQVDTGGGVYTDYSSGASTRGVISASDTSLPDPWDLGFGDIYDNYASAVYALWEAGEPEGDCWSNDGDTLYVPSGCEYYIPDEVYLG